MKRAIFLILFALVAGCSSPPATPTPTPTPPPAQPRPTAAPSVTPTPLAQTYTIQAGDTLWRIAEKFYGDGNQYQKLVEANKVVLSDPGKLTVGTTITVPK